MLIVLISGLALTMQEKKMCLRFVLSNFNIQSQNTYLIFCLLTFWIYFLRNPSNPPVVTDARDDYELQNMCTVTDCKGFSRERSWEINSSTGSEIATIIGNLPSHGEAMEEAVSRQIPPTLIGHSLYTSMQGWLIIIIFIHLLINYYL